MEKMQTTYISDANFRFGKLEAFLNDAQQRGRWHERAVNVRLTNVTLNAKYIRRMYKTYNINAFNCTNHIFFFK